MRPGGASARLVGERAQREARGKPRETGNAPESDLVGLRGPRGLHRAREPRCCPAAESAKNYSSRHAPGGSLPCCLTPRGRRFRSPPPPHAGAAAVPAEPPAPLRVAPARRGPAAAPCVQHGPRRPPRGFPRDPPADCAAPPRGPVHPRARPQGRFLPERG
ncbi:undifferentiated embryonic cell transcription factor 1-like [Accipiter gentilis]|uniref:undifferentiated embryonic cell transcription factor 1-like n=1 Tax=Astur gentilis TaxID=8957 RepID=UPI002110D70F|nr:undifferentiated embryonic cell transcription factor 1-like [Accipiter gentilis]